MRLPDWIASLNSAHEGVLLFENQTHVVYANSAAETLFLRSSKELCQLTLSEVIKSDLDSRTLFSSPEPVHGYILTGPKGLLSVQMRASRIDETRALVFIADRSAGIGSSKTIDMLARISEKLGASLDLQQTFLSLVQLAVPSLSDGAVLLSTAIATDTAQTSSGNSKPRFFVSCHHSDSHKAESLKYYFQQLESLQTSDLDFTPILISGEPLNLSATIDGSQYDILCLPIKERHDLTALLCLIVETPRQFGAEDLIAAHELARRGSSAIENAHLYKRAKDMERSLLEAKRTAEEDNSAKTLFLASMSHEIRTPLSAILGFSELLLSQEAKTSDQQDWVERIRSNGSHLLRLIDDILNVTKIESGTVQIEPVPIYFFQFLSELYDYFKPRAASKNISFTFRFTTPVPERFLIDTTRLHQILSNLIGNAVKFTSHGGVEVVFRYELHSKYLVIVVSDTGPGLTAEQAQKLFNPFSQGDTAHSRLFGGTGLGLMVARQMARLMKGDVELLQSQPNVGTQFQVALPIDLMPESRYFSSLTTEKTPSERAKPTDQQVPPLKGHKILLVDDSADNRLLIGRLLTIAGAEVSFANDGRDGIAKAFSGHHDAVLMDIQMPEVDGYQAARELRSRGYQGPIVALTACALTDGKNDAFQFDFDGYLTKPVSREHLVAAIKDIGKLSVSQDSQRRLFAPTAKTEASP